MAPGDTSVVVVTWNRRATVLQTMARLSRLPEQPHLILVDNGSRDGTPEAVSRRFPQVEVISLPENVGIAARNVGVRHAGTPIVALSDDDSWWAPGALSSALRSFARHPRLGLIAARVVVEPLCHTDTTSLEMAASPLLAPDLPGRPVLGFVGCGAVVRRSAFLEVGGFSPRLFIGGEEQLLALDLAARGWGLAYLDEVVAHHRAGPRDRAARRRQVMRNDLWVSWLRRPWPLVLRHTVRAALRGLADPEVRAALLNAMGGLRWVLSERQVLPAQVERQLRAVEAARSRAARAIPRSRW